MAAKRAPSPPRRKRKSPLAQGDNGSYVLEADELEFIAAINRFKERTGRMFPSWSEILTIVRELGYRK